MHTAAKTNWVWPSRLSHEQTLAASGRVEDPYAGRKPEEGIGNKSRVMNQSTV